jgi:hypothetical protein
MIDVMGGIAFFRRLKIGGYRIVDVLGGLRLICLINRKSAEPARFDGIADYAGVPLTSEHSG